MANSDGDCTGQETAANAECRLASEIRNTSTACLCDFFATIYELASIARATDEPRGTN